MTQMEVHPDLISRSGRLLAADGEEFAQLLASFRARAAAFDGAWGDDIVGTYIGTAYTEVAAWAFDCWQAVADEIADAGDDLGLMGESYQRADDDAAARFTGIVSGLGTGQAWA